MAEPSTAKQRLCVRTTGSYELDADGFLATPGAYVNKELFGLASVLGSRLVVLLGEPGIGKSTSLRATYAEAAANPLLGHRYAFLDFGEYGSEDRLVREVFDTGALAEWSAGTFELDLFVDGFDEALLRIETLARLFSLRLARLPIGRLRLRIASRTAVWPAELTDALVKLWGASESVVCELLPLRREDVVNEVQARGIDPEQFIADATLLNVVPLVVKPITLDLLIRVFAKSGAIGKDQFEVYATGCRLLCEELAGGRQAGRAARKLSNEERFVVAARIAIALMFAGRSAVWNDVSDEGREPSDLRLAEIVGGTELVNGQPIGVDLASLQEALDTGVFTSRGPRRMGLAHQTFGEFLSAWYIREHVVGRERLLSLIAHPSDPDGGVVPQLAEVAAWVATQDDALFDALVARDPNAILRSDVAAGVERTKARLVAELLRRYEDDKLFDWGIETRRRFRRLRHAGLQSQLLPYLTDKNRKAIARSVAIDLAEAAELRNLVPELTRIALDGSELTSLRVNAAYAVTRLGTELEKQALEPLLTDSNDPQDELFGCALEAMWPNSLGADRLFALLHPPRERHLIGSYSVFLSHHLSDRLTVEHLPAALAWARGQASQGRLDFAFERLVDEIIVRVVRSDNPDLLEPLAATLLTRQRESNQFLDRPGDYGDIFDDQVIRRRLVREMLRQARDIKRDRFELLMGRPAVLRQEDAEWLLDNALADDPPGRDQWLSLLEIGMRWDQPAIVEKLYAALQAQPDLSPNLLRQFQPIDLASDDARVLREAFSDARPRRGKTIDLALRANGIETALNASESGSTPAWVQLNHYLAVPDGESVADNNKLLDDDLRTYPGWASLDEPTRARVFEAGRRFVLDHQTQPSAWAGTNLFPFTDFAGYRALRLLLDEDRPFLSRLPSAIWERWVAVVVNYPTSSNDFPAQAELMKLAYAKLPGAVLSAIDAVIEYERSLPGRDYLGILEKLDAFWDQGVATLIAQKAADEVKPKMQGQFLKTLLAHNEVSGLALADRLLDQRNAGTETSRGLALAAAVALLSHAEGGGWSHVWPLMSADDGFAEEVVQSLGENWFDAEKIPSRLDDEGLAALFLWLMRHHPPSEDVRVDGFMSSGQHISGLRDTLVRTLRSRATSSALAALENLSKELPGESWLLRVVAEARDLRLVKSWVPFAPAVLVRVLRDPRLRIVESPDQLLAVIREAIGGVEDELQGKYAAVPLLWDEVKPGVFQPKGEWVLADYIARFLESHLAERGIVANREVQIRHGVAGSPGERVDIQIDAIADDATAGAAVVSVVIEVKCSWNRGVLTDLERQVFERYLKDIPTRHALYVVGYYNCVQWDRSDRRHKQSKRWSSIEQLAGELRAAAANVNKSDVMVDTITLNVALR